MRVLITGASGHIGGAAARLLRDRGHSIRAAVRCLDRAPEGCEAVRLDLADATPDDITRATTGCDAIVHAAAWMHDDPNAENALSVNAIATLRLLEAARNHARVFVLISGMIFLRKPLTGSVCEEYPVEMPRDLYGLGKLAAEGLARWFAGQAPPYRVVILRPSSPVGPGLRRRRIFSLFCDAAAAGKPIYLHGSGTRVQDYVDARDAARATAAAIEQPNAAGVFHIGSGRAVSNLELARRCAAILNPSAEIRFSGQPDPEEGPDWVLDISRAARELNWTPAIPLEDSIRDYAAWRNAAPDRAREDDP